MLRKIFLKIFVQKQITIDFPVYSIRVAKSPMNIRFISNEVVSLKPNR